MGARVSSHPRVPQVSLERSPPPRVSPSGLPSDDPVRSLDASRRSPATHDRGVEGRCNERPLSWPRLSRSGLGRAVRPCSQPTLWPSVGTEARGRPADRPWPREPTSKPRPSGTAVHGDRPQGRLVVVSRRQPIRRGSEQWTVGHLSLDGSRGGGGNRDSPDRNAGQSRRPHSYSIFTTVVRPAVAPSPTGSGGC